MAINHESNYPTDSQLAKGGCLITCIILALLLVLWVGVCQGEAL